MGDSPLDRDEFPVAEEFVYLDNAGSAPIPRRSLEAITAVHEAVHREGRRAYHRAERAAEEVRESAAMLMGVATQDVCFVKNTTEGIGFVANGLDWQEGDRVIVARHEFPSNLWPWTALADRGVEVVQLDPQGDGEAVTTEDYVAALADGGARVLAVSWVQYRRGHRADLEALAAACIDHGALLAVDAIQGLGYLPARFSAWNVDFAVADGHKWLLGPQGTGIMHVSTRGREVLRPLERGWNSAVNRGDYTDPTFVEDDTARRYEGGSLDVASIAGLGASIQMIVDAGIDQVWNHIEELTSLAARRLVNLGATILSDRTIDGRSGILTFTLPGLDARAVIGELGEAGVICGARGEGIRISPHGYNTAEDVDQMIETLASVMKIEEVEAKPRPSIAQGPMRRPSDW